MRFGIDFSPLRTKKSFQASYLNSYSKFLTRCSFLFSRNARARSRARAHAGARVCEGKAKNDIKNENANRHLRFGIDFSPLRTKKIIPGVFPKFLL